MLRYAIIAFLTVILPTTSSFAFAVAVAAKDKMATCKFGADDQKLQGAARSAFMKKCMSNKDDPRGSAAPGAMAPEPKN
jgi:hypothetical protein